MKKKIFSSLVIFSLVILLATLVFIAFDIVNPLNLWVKYVILISLIILGLSLNFSFKKLTDFDETISCLKRAITSIEGINSASKATRYVKILTIVSQLYNAITYLEDVIAAYELYPLRYDLGNLKVIKNRYELAQDNSDLLTKDLVLEDIDILKSIMDAVKKYKVNR